MQCMYKVECSTILLVKYTQINEIFSGIIKVISEVPQFRVLQVSGSLQYFLSVFGSQVNVLIISMTLDPFVSAKGLIFRQFGYSPIILPTLGKGTH